ncbi:3-keto-5-aminohexanoate cleavage protein [Desulfovibrio oxyclinae]|uniref:3-keto-5-aminohexanoate cleavage protein n=1 Tax=Desulfovibrio oxyclinae TaxID=63560 RepID=UPI000370D56F|nr:3-keto-5-aminohexanoate cleavage protein [Desulfovibrio oxyclinae]
MNTTPIITCAITGAGDTADKNPAVPVTPKEIAESAIAARKAGAAVAHIHVRDPETGKPSRAPELYREVVEHIRESGSDVIINLTAGMGGDFVPDENEPNTGGAGSDMAGAEERIAHIRELKPEICTLDCGSMNYADAAYITTPDQLRTMAAGIAESGVKPEIEVFEMGHVWMAKQLIQEKLIAAPPLFQLCMGIPFCAPATPEAMLTLRNQLPEDAVWAGFGIGRNQFPFAAQALLMGGHMRVGLEDNLYLKKGVAADNVMLVQKAVQLADTLGATPATPDHAREILGLNQ